MIKLSVNDPNDEPDESARNQQRELPPDTMSRPNTIWAGTNEDKSEFFVHSDSDHISKAAFLAAWTNTEEV